jgi:hypothetical protein
LGGTYHRHHHGEKNRQAMKTLALTSNRSMLLKYRHKHSIPSQCASVASNC